MRPIIFRAEVFRSIPEGVHCLDIGMFRPLPLYNPIIMGITLHLSVIVYVTFHDMTTEKLACFALHYNAQNIMLYPVMSVFRCL